VTAKAAARFIIKDTFNHAQLSVTERYVENNKKAVAEVLKKAAVTANSCASNSRNEDDGPGLTCPKD
jgi:hypothetical protein